MSLVSKKGVDISSLNGDISIQKVKSAGYDFVMIHCGYGDDLSVQDDNQFENNVKKCEAAGVPWGAYLYSYALNTNDAKSEARHVIRLLKGKKPTLPIAFDMEDADGYKRKNGMPSNSTLVAICKTFLSEIKKAGYYPMLYASLSWLNNQLNDKSLLNVYDVWVAQWNSSCDYKGSYGMWQYGGEINFLESNSIPGVGTIDKDICYKDYPAIIKAGGYNNWAAGTIASPIDNSGTAIYTGVQLVQIWLNKVYNSGLEIDGIYGALTKRAIIKGLQNVLNVKYGAKLVVDGVFGAKTKAAVRPLSKGAHGGYPSILQAFLICRGYDTGGFDGEYGSRTESAVKTFQTVKGLKVTGIADAATFEALAKAG